MEILSIVLGLFVDAGIILALLSLVPYFLCSAYLAYQDGRKVKAETALISTKCSLGGM